MTDNLKHEPGHPHQAWLFNAGKWVVTDDLVMNRPEDEVTTAIEAAGYSNWTGVGDEHATPLKLTVWSRSAKPSFLFDIEGPEKTEFVYAETLPDALALLNQLAPTLQALTITDQIARAEPKSMSVLADVLDKLHDRRRDEGSLLLED